MSEEYYAAVLNPFSKEGKELVQESPPFDSLSERIIDLAVKRVNYRYGPEVKVGFNKKEIKDEVISFYLMAQAVATVSYPYSNETRTVIEATRDTINYRMYDLFRRGHEELCLDLIGRYFRLRELEGENEKRLGDIKIPQQDIYKIRDLELAKNGIETVDDEIIPQYIPKYAIRWMDLSPLIDHRQLDLTEQYIVKGWAILTPKKLWNFFANYVGSEMEEYISRLYDKFSERGPPAEILKEVGERISKEIPEEKKYKKFRSFKSSKLRSEAFPPCIKEVLGGVHSGNRNYGIVMLLTPFLSYARISPSGKAVNRISDFIDNISIIEDEVIPLIFEAAEKCNPPLFKDQPQDKANIYYHMGFGMTTKPRLKDSGKSKWYRPPNCRKIKTEAPALCNPDDLCSDVKNPLTYYYKKRSQGTGGEDD